jgi:DNA-damage-inducible protein J
MPTDSIVKARIDTKTKEKAAAGLGAMGLSISDAIRLLMLRVAEEQRLPFDVQVRNAASRQEMKELNEGRWHRSASAEVYSGIWASDMLTPFWSGKFKRDVKRAERRARTWIGSSLFCFC